MINIQMGFEKHLATFSQPSLYRHSTQRQIRDNVNLTGTKCTFKSYSYSEIIEN